MDGIDGTSCKDGFDYAECSSPKNPSVPTASEKEEPSKQPLLTIFDHIEANPELFGIETTSNLFVFCITTRRRDEANENVKVGGVG